MKAYESRETYLETILVLIEKNGCVRAVDIANELDFSKPSVSRGMKLLRDLEYITVEKNGNILLTIVGKAQAEKIYERHKIITQFLIISLKISHENASADACRMEHIISDVTFYNMKQYVHKHTNII